MNNIQEYFKHRQSLIDQYIKGDMNKNEYLRENFTAVISLRKEPFKILDNVDKCLFNYQYYNAYAKESKMFSMTKSDFNEKNDYMKKADYYYNKKDGATLAALKLLNFKNVSAYFIKVKSKQLNGKLIEIFIDEYEMVLHSVSERLLSTLKYEGVFVEELRTSKVDYYINQKY